MGQRVVCFYDLDKHIIEVGESTTMVVRRFIESGLSIEETASRMDVSPIPSALTQANNKTKQPVFIDPNEAIALRYITLRKVELLNS